MSRRGTPQVLAFVAVGVIFVYGFYSYYELKSALRRSDENIKRSKLENDNLSTQLLGMTDVIMVILYNPESSITQHTHQCACRLSGLLKLWIRLNKLVNHHLLGKCCCCLFSRVSLYGAVVASNL